MQRDSGALGNQLPDIVGMIIKNLGKAVVAEVLGIMALYVMKDHAVGGCGLLVGPA